MCCGSSTVNFSVSWPSNWLLPRPALWRRVPWGSAQPEICGRLPSLGNEVKQIVCDRMWVRMWVCVCGCERESVCGCTCVWERGGDEGFYLFGASQVMAGILISCWCLAKKKKILIRWWQLVFGSAVVNNHDANVNIDTNNAGCFQSGKCVTQRAEQFKQTSTQVLTDMHYLTTTPTHPHINQKIKELKKPKLVY